jgi:hypothetical protein
MEATLKSSSCSSSPRGRRDRRWQNYRAEAIRYETQRCQSCTHSGSWILRWQFGSRRQGSPPPILGYLYLCSNTAGQRCYQSVAMSYSSLEADTYSKSMPSWCSMTSPVSNHCTGRASGYQVATPSRRHLPAEVSAFPAVRQQTWPVRERWSEGS